MKNWEVSTTNRRCHYGPVSAIVDDETKTVKVLLKRYKEPLPDATIARCIRWAMQDLDDLAREGYAFDLSGVDIFFVSE
jgi:hypothetical protein